MSISSAVMPIAFISFQAFERVPSDVPKPGIVYPRMVLRGRPSVSQARAATSRAWVLSSPPEIPMTSDLGLVASIRRTSAETWILNAS